GRQYREHAHAPPRPRFPHVRGRCRGGQSGASHEYHRSVKGDRRRDIRGAHEGMTDDEVLGEFRAAEALLEGHFILSSGLRSPKYLQCARVLMDPARAERLAKALAAKIPADLRGQIEAVVAPAMGGLIIGYEVARALGVDSMFVERPSGTFELR